MVVGKIYFADTGIEGVILKSLDEILALFRPEDELSVPLATGQPLALMNALATRTDWKRLHIFTGLLGFPYPILTHPNVFVTSGYYGPIERFLNNQGAHMEYLPASFSGLEIFALKKPTRVIATTLSMPDADGFCTFGTHGAAIARPFTKAAEDPNRIAIAEINPQMPVVYGSPDTGDNKIHLSKLKHFFVADQSQLEVPALGDISPEEKKIAENVLGLIETGATLQLGIGRMPDYVASQLAMGNKGNFGIHSELISDGWLQMKEAGKISGTTVFTFAFGSKKLYDFLDERNGKNRRSAICLPVGIVNDPHFIAQNKNMTSVNSALMVDFAGQVCSEAIGLKQYSGVGGQMSFVQGAYDAENGKTILCIKSTATVDGKLVSNIVPTLPPGSLISTPRYLVQTIVTEYGIANLYGVSDEKRGELLIPLAHPQFREELAQKYAEMKSIYYKN